MSYALILKHKVVDVVKQPFPVHPDFEWVECDETVSTGHSYINGTFIPNET